MILIPKMPWTGLLLITHLCWLCHSNPVDVGLWNTLLKELGISDNVGNLEADFDNIDNSEADTLIHKGKGNIENLKKHPGAEEKDDEFFIDGYKIKSLPPDIGNLGAKMVSSDEATGESESIPNIPGLEKRKKGLYFNGNRVKNIIDLGPDDSDGDDDDGDDDVDDVDNDDDVPNNIVINDDDGIIEPDVGWQDENNTDTSDSDDDEV